MICIVAFLFLYVMNLWQCDAITETQLARFDRLVNYDGLSCSLSAVMFLQTDVRSKINCVKRCSETPECTCVFYKHGYCQGCQGLCHRGATLPALTGTAYYFLNKKPAVRISSVAGAFSYGLYSYLAVNNTTTWQNALNYCNNLDATLLYIDSQVEFDIIVLHLGPYDYWTGGKSSGQYVWSHNGATIDMSWFADGEPNSNSCARLRFGAGYKLADMTCGSLYRFICKSF